MEDTAKYWSEVELAYEEFLRDFPNEPSALLWERAKELVQIRKLVRKVDAQAKQEGKKYETLMLAKLCEKDGLDLN